VGDAEHAAGAPEPRVTPLDDERDFAERTILGWHALFGVIVAFSGVILASAGHASLAVPLLAVLVLAYALVAVPGARRGSTRAVVTYLALAYLVLAVLAWQDESALLLLFALYPQGFLLLPRRGSIIATIVLTSVFTLELIAQDGWTGEAVAWRGLMAVGNLVVALIIGLFIDGLIRESSSRKQLVDELRATQAELAVAEREAGATAERERLAREIHDTLAQGFTSIVVLAQTAEAAMLAGEAPEATRRLAEIQRTARENLAEARALVGSMAPPELQSRGLAEALERVSRRHSERTGVPVDFRVEGDVRPLPSSSEVAALRAAQELLANAGRHAGASRITVVLRFDEDGATVAVTDDGRGFDPAAPRSGFGLDGLAARIEEAGGLSEIRSTPGGGTSARVRVP
jgi:signal transduction histidine kinase